MDPLSAIGLSSNILQFVDFASTLIGKGFEIYRSAEGSTAIHTDLHASSDRLRELARSLISRGIIPQDEEEQHIVKIALDCNAIAKELAEALDELTATPGSWRSSALKALQNLWDHAKIEETQRRLVLCRDDLQLHLSKALLSKQSFIQRSFDDLTTNNEILGLKSDQMVARIQCLKEDVLDALRQLPSSHANPLASSAAQGKLGALYIGHEEIVKSGDMLRSLRFSRMRVRRYNVVERYETTLDWVFDRTHAGKDLHFLNWLERGDGIYWVSGNAGSGKSTLMKFIYLDPRTKQYLLEWVRFKSAKSLIMADFFFWKPGTELEGSQEGLLRTLLYEVLRQWPEIMPDILGNRWNEWIQDQYWTLSELRSAIRKVGQQEGGNKFCFFIDGLDEYMGQSHEIAQAVQEISASANIKLCVSSRPWNVFQAAFGSNHEMMLQVHEHNEDDIRLYVHAILGHHRVYQRLKAEDVRYESILRKIVQKAKGVFLWVFLVVRNLEETLPNEDTVESLEELVDEFPSELEPYFERMIDVIDRRYHERSARILLMVMRSEHTIPLVLVAHVMPKMEDQSLNTRPENCAQG